MPQHLEPTYLRYIYDGLVKGTVHSENAADLPDGLIGLYEEAFNERTSVIERQKLLNRFAIWALLKKEVSTAFVAELLNEPEEETQAFMSTYSSWFNSPESGKYQLYHERLKVYLLQKMSEGEVNALHQALVARIEKSVMDQKADEFEGYGLEFLANHLVIDETINFSVHHSLNIRERLVQPCIDGRFVARQIEISKGILWTRDSIFLICTFLEQSKISIPSVLFERLIDLHKQEESRVIRLLYNLENNNYLSVFEIFKIAQKNNTIDFQLAVVFYCLFIQEIIDAESLIDKEEILNKVVPDFTKFLAESTVSIYEVLPQNMLISIVIEYNKFINDCFKDIFLSGFFVINDDFKMEFFEVFYNLEINEEIRQNYISICDCLIDYFKSNDEYDLGYDFALEICELKITSLFNLDDQKEAMEFIEFEKKEHYFEHDDLMAIEEKLKLAPIKEQKTHVSTGITHLADFERFTFYPWTIQVISCLEENNVAKAKSLMNNVFFDFLEINALFEFLWRRNQTRYLKFILVNAKEFVDNKWEASWCHIIFESPIEFNESAESTSSSDDLIKKKERDFIENLFECTNLKFSKNQRDLVIQKLANKSFEYSTHIRAIAHAFISILHFQNGNDSKADEYFSKTIKYYSENLRKIKTIEIQKFLVFNLTKRHDFERSLQYLKELNEKDLGVQSKILMHEISKVLKYNEIIEWVSRLVDITENTHLMDEIIVTLNVLEKTEVAKKIINSMNNSESKFLARLRLAELNEGNNTFPSEIASTIHENYRHCLNKDVLVRLIKLGMLDCVREIFDFEWSKQFKKTVLIELTKDVMATDYFLQLVIKFKDNLEYTESLTLGYLNVVKHPTIDSSILIALILLNKNGFEIGFKLQTLFFINEYLKDSIDPIQFKVLSDKYGLQWAIDIKNQLPN
jgi:hypothetical protein